MKKSVTFIIAALASIAAGAASLATSGSAARSRAPAPVERARAIYQQRMLADPNGDYDAARIQSSLVARQKLLAARRAVTRNVSNGGGFTPYSSNPVGINWTEIGPGNVGGRINTIWVDPTNGQHLIVGAAGGGLWQSLDGGQSWTAIAAFPEPLRSAHWRRSLPPRSWPARATNLASPSRVLAWFPPPMAAIPGAQ